MSESSLNASMRIWDLHVISMSKRGFADFVSVKMVMDSRECVNQVLTDAPENLCHQMCIHIHYVNVGYSLYMYSIPFTETGGISIAPRPSPNNQTPKPGFPMRPFFGIEPVLVDEEVNCVCTSLGCVCACTM